MRSLAEIVGEVNNSNAVAKLVRIPSPVTLPKPQTPALYEMLFEKALEQEYGKALARARTQERKLFLIKEYAQHPGSYVSKIEWFKSTITGLELTFARIDRRKKPTDPVKIEIARIKEKHPKIPHHKICTRLDAAKIPLPERWQRSGNRTWAHAYRDSQLRPLLKSFISKVKV